MNITDLKDPASYKYVDANNHHMNCAAIFALDHSLDLKQKVACLIVDSHGVQIGIGANGSTYHETNGCERKRLGCKSGEGYDLCEGCSPKNHAEPSAIRDVRASNLGGHLEGADIYMWGHWWCCADCVAAMKAAGIRDVYLLEDARRWFDMESPDYVFKDAGKVAA